MRRLLRRLLRVLLGLSLAVGLFLSIILGTNVLVVQFAPTEAAQMVQKPGFSPPPVPDTLRLMNWNIKFGGARIDFFFDCYGDRVHMQRHEVEANLKALADYINRYRPHILLLQEADWEADRSARLNQVQYLLDHCPSLGYAAYASQWHVKWLPSNGLGYVNSGSAVLSSFPIVQATRHALPRTQAQDALTRFFWLRRNLLQAQLDLAVRGNLNVFTTHLEAYAKDDTRRLQLQEIMRLLQASPGPVLFGGDLNTLPPGTAVAKGFDDNVCNDPDFVMDDYSRELTWLEPFYARYRELIPDSAYRARPERYFSHTVNGRGWWNRRLDYLFTTLSWHRGEVHQNASSSLGRATMPLSDHAPLTGQLVLPAVPAGNPPKTPLPAANAE